MDDSNKTGRENRVFKRYSIKLTASMRVKSIGNELVNTNFAPVEIKDLSLGGLSFISVLDIPIRSDVILEFNTQLFGKISGFIIWKKKNKDFFHYGVKIISTQSKLYKLVWGH